MMDLQRLRILHLDNCNGIVSLIDLPPNLTQLSACDCKQLQSLPNEWHFERIFRTEFIFTNCMDLEETAVSNMLARLVKHRHLGCSNFTFCYPGSEVPKWFRNPTKGSSTKFQEALGHKLKGFAVCAVIAFEKYLFKGDSRKHESRNRFDGDSRQHRQQKLGIHFDGDSRQHNLGIYFDGTYSDGNQSSPINIMSATAYVPSRNRTLIDSDHVAFGYCDASSDWLVGRGYSFEFRLSEESPNCRVKSWGVCPIYFQDFGTDEAGTSGSRFDEEEMNHIPKRMRICRQ